MQEYKLTYGTPAKSFSQALPLGNGSFGAMIHGDFPDFHYSLNADTLWSGTENNLPHVKVSGKDLQRARALLEEKKYFLAEQLVQEKMTGKTYNQSYVCPGFLRIQFQETEENRDFYRELCLNTALGKTRVITETNQIEIRSFLSCSHDVLVTEILSKKPISFCIWQESELQHKAAATTDTLFLTGEAPEHVEPNYVECDNPVIYGKGMGFALITNIETDGFLDCLEDKIHLKGGSRTLLLTAIETGYRGFQKPLERRREILQNQCLQTLLNAKKAGLKILYEQHIKQHKELFERVDFSLDKDTKYPLLFQYGRYLMICSSRPGKPLCQPGNLQGIWCEDIRPMWSCNMTVNINTEMNYWLTGPCNLSECDQPLFQMLEEAAETGRITAEETFGCRGWTACHNIDLWRHTSPVKGNTKWAYWPMGGVWLATHLYRHYQFTNDKVFLENQAYPLLLGSARFCLDWMYESRGILHSAPSTSPENTFLDQEGRECSVCDSSTMDIILIREILTETREVGRLLGETGSFMEELEAALKKLPEYKVGAYGQLLEWGDDLTEADVHHRHFAHLAGFHPFHQIDCDNRPGLRKAVEEVLRRRTEGTDCFIGWDEAWLTNFYARLCNGNEAKRHIDFFLEHCAYENLFSLHPPLGQTTGEREIFQIDGNFGITEGIREMLMFTKPGVISLLPALPRDWKKGEIQGLICCGGHKLSIFWEGGHLARAVLWGCRNEMLSIRCKTSFSIKNQQGLCLHSRPEGEFFTANTLVQKGANLVIIDEKSSKK